MLSCKHVNILESIVISLKKILSFAYQFITPYFNIHAKIFLNCIQRAQAALQAVNALHGGGMASMAISTDAASIAGATAQSPVLRVIVENLFYPVTLDVLHQVHACF